ncbi:MAG: staphyloferrin synthase [Actinomycetota bacterium]|nr:staphyloferrin synthase [Actinomycetota bacterium]
MRTLSLRPDDGRRETEADVLAALVDGLIAEDLFGFRSRARIGSVAGALYLPLTGDERHVQVGLGSGAVVFRARPVAALGPYRLSRPPVLLLGPEGIGPVPLSPRDLLDLVATRLAERRPPNLDEVLDGLELAVTHGATLHGAAATWSRVRTAPTPTLLDWEALTALGDRPFHPTGRARVGWDQARHRRYSPGADRPVALDWVAVRRDHLASGSFDRLAGALALARGGRRSPDRFRPEVAAGPSDRPPTPAEALLAADDRAMLAAATAGAGVDGPDHVVLPVHPWQHAHVLPELFAGEWRSGVCVPVATGIGAFRPTASTRTLVPAGAGPVHVKLPVGISTLGALRLLPPRYLANAAAAQTLLETAAERHPALQGRLHACDERAWWVFADPGQGSDYGDRPGHLGCLLRVWPDGLGSGPGRSLVPLGALGVVTAADPMAPTGAPAGLARPSAPGLARLVADRGDDPASPEAALAVFDDVARVVSEVALACFGLGFAPELHGQNAVLACEGGRVAGIVLRDHDTVRLHRPWLAAADLPDPGYDVKPGTPNSLLAASPEELLGWFQTLALQLSLRAIGRALVSVYGVDEETVWRRLAQVVRAARAGVDLPPAAAEVTDRQLFRATGWPTKLVLGPLLARVGTGGGSMPSAAGRAGNPFLAGDDRAAELAGHAAAERLVNCFLRESDVDPVLVGSTMTIPFARTGRAVIGSVAYHSAVGHHRFRPGFSLRTGEGLGPSDLARLVAAELAADDEAGPSGSRHRFVAAVDDSIVKTRSFLERLPVTGTVDPWQAPHPFLAAEHSLRLGHPLHPAAKASDGFSAADLESYAPELGASFPLRWLAVDPELVAEDRLATVRSLDPPPALCDAAAGELGGARATWPLLPCHPWQAAHLARLPAVAELLAAGRVVALGPLGPAVAPTASVRTVWDPASGRQLKLPLAVRITNFVRENSPEQLRRSLDASRVLAALGDLAVAVDGPEGSFGVLLELGYRRIMGSDALGAATGVLYREGPPMAGAASPMVVAALLEPDPIDGVPPIIRAVQQTGLPAGDGRAWLERYLQLSLRPLVRLLVRHGVGLEAHAQNSLVALDDGWPARFVVRDLEGASLNRDHPRAGDGFGADVAADSPAVYGETEVWQRFAYYFLVNHLGQLVATLAEHLGPSEAELWRVAGGLLGDEAVRHGADPAAAPLRLLLDGPDLPAKANLTSVLRGHSEHPSWVAIPNPLRARPGA